MIDTYGSQELFMEIFDYIETTVSEAGGVYQNYTQLDSWGGNPVLFNDEVHMLPMNSTNLMDALFTSAGLTLIETPEEN